MWHGIISRSTPDVFAWHTNVQRPPGWESVDETANQIAHLDNTTIQSLPLRILQYILTCHISLTDSLAFHWRLVDLWYQEAPPKYWHTLNIARLLNASNKNENYFSPSITLVYLCEVVAVGSFLIGSTAASPPFFSSTQASPSMAKTQLWSKQWLRWEGTVGVQGK